MPATSPPAIIQSAPVLPYEISVFGRPLAASQAITTTISEPAVDLAVETDGLISSGANPAPTPIVDAERAFETLQRSQRDAERATRAAAALATWAPR